MAEKKPGSPNAVKELKGFIAILVILWLIWFFTDGPKKSKDEKPFVEPISDIQTSK